MSDRALRGYARAMDQQHIKNEARRIRSLVKQHRENPQRSGPRWPFELLQNALDAGPRHGREAVSITIQREGSTLTVSHDGQPFTFEDLAALLSGGSNKEFESERTTGRFGTGFLVTHALSTTIDLKGFLFTGDEFEQFELQLDRGGDEAAIEANIEACKERINCAEAIDYGENTWSACFKYLLEDEYVADAGIAAFQESLPYLYATRSILGRVAIELPGRTEVWTAGDVGTEEFEDGMVRYRSVTVESDAGEDSTFDVYWFSEKEEGGSAIVIVDHQGESMSVRLPSASSRKLFRDYPLQNSAFLPISFIINGKFNPDSERSMIASTDANMNIVEEALRGAVLGVKYAFGKNWMGAHLLARASKSSVAAWFNDEELAEPWNRCLLDYAQRLSDLDIVETAQGRLHAAREDSFADFVVPRLSLEAQRDQTEHSRMWSLVDGTSTLYPPKLDVSADWTETAFGWHELGVELNRISIAELLSDDHVRTRSDEASSLLLREPYMAWLTRFLDVVGECKQNSGTDVLGYLECMLVNQNGKLRSPSALSFDGGIPETLKNIALDIGEDLRDELLSQDFIQAADAEGLSFVGPLLERVVGSTTTEDDLIERLIAELDERLPRDKRCDERDEAVKFASLKLVDFLWMTRGSDAKDLARQVPLITRDDKAVRWSEERMMLAPPEGWPESARPFAAVYPEQRLLSDLYHTFIDDGLNCIEPLVAWGLAYAEPLYVFTAEELSERRLRWMAPDGKGATANDVKVSAVAVLPDALLRCESSPDYSKALLGLILCYVVPNDAFWREEQLIIGRRAGEAVGLMVRPALWIADLKSRAWVAHENSDGEIEPRWANAYSLSELLEPEWLSPDAIDFLASCFDFNALDLELLRFGDDQKSVANDVAQIIRHLGEDPEAIRRLAEEVRDKVKKGKEVERARRIGSAVEKAIEATLISYGLVGEVVDRGFDIRVTEQRDFSFEDLSWDCEVGEYFIEIKATTTGTPRMTPLQAETASGKSEKYVLCVVDLRDVPEGELDAEWTTERVEALTKMVPTIGSNVKSTWTLVEEASTANDVKITNQSALRYSVSPGVWESGLPIKLWAQGLRTVVT